MKYSNLLHKSGCVKAATLLLFFCLGATTLHAQTDKTTTPLPKVYNEHVDAMLQITQAVEQAQRTDKYVLCQVGGNWCPWCLRFANLVETDSAINAAVNNNYVYIHVNTSKGNKNAKALEYLGNPGRFGYPVFVILDGNGNRLHTQNSSYLEEGKGYNTKLVVDFLLNWTRKAIETMK